MSDRLTIALNVTNKAPSQYLDIPFESAVEFNGKLLFFGESGVYEEGGQLDVLVDIDAWVDTPLHDFGSRDQKSIEAYDIGYEAADGLTMTLYAAENEDTARSFSLDPIRPDQVQQDMMQTLKKYKYGKARYWKVRVANVDGGDFSLDYLALAPVFLKRRSQ